MFPKSCLGSRFNSLSAIAGAVINVSEVVLSVGQTQLYVADRPINSIFLSASAAESISDIAGGRNGYLLFVISMDDNVTIECDATKIMLNSAPAGTDLVLAQYDVLALINYGGNPDILVNGYWQEIFRTIKV